VYSLPHTLAAVDRDAREVVNDIIAAAVDSWPLPERLRRLSIPVLSYRDDDFNAYSIALVYCESKWGSDPVGVIARCFETVAADAPYLFLHGLYLSPAAQRRGLGRRLLADVEMEARHAGATGVLVKAERVALPFFVASGYVQLETGVGPGGEYPYRCWRALSRDRG
jgi:GNAT superfamily N-acetyltransferase